MTTTYEAVCKTEDMKQWLCGKFHHIIIIRSEGYVRCGVYDGDDNVVTQHKAPTEHEAVALAIKAIQEVT
jgi:hypothetical protein